MPKLIADPKEKLLSVARQQIETNGYSATTIRSVARSCGISVGTVYNYFPSKEALVAAYMLNDWQSCMAAVTAAENAASSAKPVAQCIYEQLRLYASRHSALFNDSAALSVFSGALSQYHSMLRAQLAKPLRRFCPSEFAADFIAEALITWTMAGKELDEILAMLTI